MRKFLIFFLAVVLLCLAAPAMAQPYHGYPLQLCTNATGDPAPCKWLRWLPNNSAGMGTLDMLPVGSALYKWDATLTRFVAWDGASSTATLPGYTRLMDGSGVSLGTIFGAHADGLANSENGLNTASFLYGFNGTTWDRIDSFTHADNVANTANGSNTSSFLYGFDGTNWDRLRAVAMGDNIAAGTTGLFSASVAYAYDGAALDRMTLTAYGDALGATQQALDTLSYNLFYDGTNARRWQGITMADNLTYPTAPFVGSVLLASDGATLDMLKVSATGALEVEDTSTRPGEDAALGAQHVSIKARTEYDPAKQTTTGVVGAFSVVLTAVDVSGQGRCCVYLQNDAGDGDPFVDASILFGPKTTDMPTLGNGSWTACDTLADGEVCFYCWDDAHGAVEVQVKAAAADVDVDAWLRCTQ